MGAGSDSRRDSILHCDWSVVIYQQHNNRHVTNHSLSNVVIQLHNNDRRMTAGLIDNFFSSFHYISSRGRRHYFSRLPYSFCLTGNSPELFSFADMACNLVSKLCRRSVFTQLVSCRVLFLLVGQFFVCV